MVLDAIYIQDRTHSRFGYYVQLGRALDLYTDVLPLWQLLRACPRYDPTTGTMCLLEPGQLEASPALLAHNAAVMKSVERIDGFTHTVNDTHRLCSPEEYVSSHIDPTQDAELLFWRNMNTHCHTAGAPQPMSTDARAAVVAAYQGTIQALYQLQPARFTYDTVVRKDAQRRAPALNEQRDACLAQLMAATYVEVGDRLCATATLSETQRARVNETLAYLASRNIPVVGHGVYLVTRDGVRAYPHGCPPPPLA